MHTQELKINALQDIFNGLMLKNLNQSTKCRYISKQATHLSQLSFKHRHLDPDGQTDIHGARYTKREETIKSTDITPQAIRNQFFHVQPHIMQYKEKIRVVNFKLQGIVEINISK